MKNKKVKIKKESPSKFTGNIFVGKEAGSKIVQARNCIFLGEKAGSKIKKGKNLLVIRFGNKETRWKLTPKELRFMKGILYANIGPIPNHLLF